MADKGSFFTAKTRDKAWAERMIAALRRLEEAWERPDTEPEPEPFERNDYYSEHLAWDNVELCTRALEQSVKTVGTEGYAAGIRVERLANIDAQEENWNLELWEDAQDKYELVKTEAIDLTEKLFGAGGWKMPEYKGDNQWEALVAAEIIRLAEKNPPKVSVTRNYYHLRKMTPCEKHDYLQDLAWSLKQQL